MAHNHLPSCVISSIKNAVMASKETTVVPFSNLVYNVCLKFKEAGLITDAQILDDKEAKKKHILITLRYVVNGNRQISALDTSRIRVISKPGRRVYIGVHEFRKYANTLSCVILSTNKGVMTIAQAQKENVGGEIICEAF